MVHLCLTKSINSGIAFWFSNIILVINNTREHIILKKGRREYCKEKESWVDYPIEKGERIGPGEHACCCASKFVKEWRRTLKLMRKYSEMRVSLEGEDDRKAKVLALPEVMNNIAFVFNMGDNNQLVMESVSREEAKSRKIEPSLWKKLEEMKVQFISVVNKRKTASSSLCKEGAREELGTAHV
ncbi:uncharacterized protein LOC113770845 isoform X2 [Coffea eugenioides]|uniref:uncharacterized protein LOC113770845 isoform X2 n=1 Tax=Coffea eugenioides TaxID=49369 RepID=UPI000F609E5C|nr:uncharacterized protein LOC113770845 isoform X2 [Coffea eugenioides]